MLPLSKDSIILEMQATSKEAALRELAALAATQCGRFTEETIYRALLLRETFGSTGHGHGVALPHAKLDGLEDMLLCFGRSKSGIAFDATDKTPVYLFVAFLAPAHLNIEYLRVLARLTALLNTREMRHRLQYSSSAQEIINHFSLAFTQDPSDPDHE